MKEAGISYPVVVKCSDISYLLSKFNHFITIVKTEEGLRRLFAENLFEVK